VGRSLIGFLLLGIVCCAAPARALDLRLERTAQGQILTLTGEFRSGDPAKLESLLRRSPVLEARLASPGGTMVAGLEIGRIFRQAGIATRVMAGGTCASSCFFAFLGGPLRVVESGGRLGVHMHSMSGNTDYIDKLKQVLVADQLSVDDRVRLIVLLNEQFSAWAAGLIADHVVRMGVSMEIFEPLFSTSHMDVHWLTRSEMVRFNVVNIVE